MLTVSALCCSTYLFIYLFVHSFIYFVLYSVDAKAQMNWFGLVWIGHRGMGCIVFTLCVAGMLSRLQSMFPPSKRNTKKETKKKKRTPAVIWVHVCWNTEEGDKKKRVKRGREKTKTGSLTGWIFLLDLWKDGKVDLLPTLPFTSQHGASSGNDRRARCSSRL